MPIEVKNLTYSYNIGLPTETKALDGVSFEAVPGEIISIVGETGSGKSTLAQHLNGLLFAQDGYVRVDGMEVLNGDPKLAEIRRKVGVVFQYPEQQLFSETVEKEISFGPSNWGIAGAELKQRVLVSMDMMGLPRSLLERSPFTLSGGQKGRVAIASVLASDPEYIVLDEPTAGLDRGGLNELITILLSQVKVGKCVIHVTHDLELAMAISTKILVLHGGRSISFGTPSETAEYLCGDTEAMPLLPDVLKLSKDLRNTNVTDGLAWKPRELAAMLIGGR